MSDFTAAGLGEFIAARLHAEHVAIAARWLERLRVHLSVDANEVFPTDQLLDHIPLLIQEIAEYVRASDEAIAANSWVTAKAQELGMLRHSQRASVHQLLVEYRLLGGILTQFVHDELRHGAISPNADDSIHILRRINDAVWILVQSTVETFVSAYAETIASHVSRIDGFNRMVSHELRQPLSALVFAMPLLKERAASGDVTGQARLLDLSERNVVRLTTLVEQLEVLSRLRTSPADAPHVQQTDTAKVAWEVARELRDMAEARGVEIDIDPQLPTLLIDQARLQLILTNLISNAIKYSDPAKTDRYVRVEARDIGDPALIRLAVRDNGLGIPPENLGDVFRRFVRVHTSQDAQLGVRGSGLGLSIALECAEAVGGSLDVESSVGLGTTFVLTVPRFASELKNDQA